jgi:hypothetical protein
VDSNQTEAVQNVVDRVASYQDGATEGTVEQELRHGLSEAGVELGDEQVRALADAIEADPADVQVAQVLG